MHPARRSEDAVEVGEDVVRGERDELAAAPEHLPEEVEGVVWVGEVDQDGDEDAGTVAVLVDAVHPRRARREVGVAGAEEAPGEVDRPSPTGDRPHAQGVLDDDADGEALPPHGRRTLERRPVELHRCAISTNFSKYFETYI